MTSKKLSYPDNGGNVNDFKRDMGTAQTGINNHLRSRSKVKLWQQLSLTAGRMFREKRKKLRFVVGRGNDNQSVTAGEEGGVREKTKVAGTSWSEGSEAMT